MNSSAESTSQGHLENAWDLGHETTATTVGIETLACEFSSYVAWGLDPLRLNVRVILTVYHASSLINTFPICVLV